MKASAFKLVVKRGGTKKKEHENSLAEAQPHKAKKKGQKKSAGDFEGVLSSSKAQSFPFMLGSICFHIRCGG